MRQPAYVFFIVMPDLNPVKHSARRPPAPLLGLGVVDMTVYAGTITKQRMEFNDFSYAVAASG
jgi:hypothetical protein